MPFNSHEMHMFAKEYDFEIITSSPRYPQSNGLAEKSVGIVKKWLKKSLDIQECLLEYRNIPLTGISYSPSQLLMNRLCRTKIPTTQQALKPSIPQQARKLLKERQLKQKEFYDRNTKSLPPLRKGQSIQVQHPHKWCPAVVNTQHHTPRSYVITTKEGTQLRRNRRHIQQRNTPPITPAVPSPCDFSVSTDHDPHNVNTKPGVNTKQPDEEAADHKIPLPDPVKSEELPVKHSVRMKKQPVWHKDYYM